MWYACMLSHFSRVQLFATLWTKPTRLLCPWKFSSQEYWSGLHALLQGIFLTQGPNPRLFASPALVSRFFTTSATWEAPKRVHPQNPGRLLCKLNNVSLCKVQCLG